MMSAVELAMAGSIAINIGIAVHMLRTILSPEKRKEGVRAAAMSFLMRLVKGKELLDAAYLLAEYVASDAARSPEKQERALRLMEAVTIASATVTSVENMETPKAPPPAASVQEDAP